MTKKKELLYDTRIKNILIFKKMVLHIKRQEVKKAEESVRYQASNGFVVRAVAGEMLLIPVGTKTQEFNGMIMLNETGAFLWEALCEPKSGEELLQLLLEEFETDASTAQADLEAFLNTGIQNNLISVM